MAAVSPGQGREHPGGHRGERAFPPVGQVAHVEHRPTLLVARVGQETAVRGERELLGIPARRRPEAAQFPRRELEAHHVEEIRLMVAQRVDRPVAVAEPRLREDAPAGLRRNLDLGARGDVGGPQPGVLLAVGHAEEEFRPIRRPIRDAPARGVVAEQHALLPRIRGFHEDDVARLHLAPVGRVGDPLAVLRPGGVRVARFPVGEPHRRRLRVGGVDQPELVVLVAALVGHVEQLRAAGLEGAVADRFGSAGQRDALALRFRQAMEVRRVADARRDHRLAPGAVPAAETRPAEIEVGFDLRPQLGRDRRHAFDDEVGRDLRGRHEQERQQESEGGAGHASFKRR